MYDFSFSVCVCVCLQQERTSPRKDGISITKQDNGRGKKLKNNSLPNSGVPSTPILFFFLPPEGSCLTFPTSFPFVSRYFSIGKILTATRTDQMDSDNNPGIRSRSWLGVWESVRGRIFEMFPSEWVCVRGGKKCFHTCKKIRLTLIMQTFFFSSKEGFPSKGCEIREENQLSGKVHTYGKKTVEKRGGRQIFTSAVLFFVGTNKPPSGFPFGANQRDKVGKAAAAFE